MVQRDGDLPSVSLALPPVGWHRTVAHEPHWTTVEAWEKTVLEKSAKPNFVVKQQLRGEYQTGGKRRD